MTRSPAGPRSWVRFWQHGAVLLASLLFLPPSPRAGAAEVKPAAAEVAPPVSPPVEVQAWLTNTFRPWLTRSFPEITTRFYPAWLHDFPPGLLPGSFTNWLGKVFPDLETEMFPTWLQHREETALGTNLPAWWLTVQKGRYSISPAIQPVPTLVRGPYLQLGTTNSMVVRWRTDLATESRISYGTNLGRLNRTATSSGIFAEHAVQATNLSPSTKYYYSLGTVDTPLRVDWTNDIAYVTSTNSKIYVNKPGNREQVAVSRNDTFVLRLKKNRFVVSDLDQTFTNLTTNQVLVINTPNNAVVLTAARNKITPATTNHVTWVDGSNPRQRKTATRGSFLVGTTNAIRTGGDSNTFFVTHPPVGQPKPTRIWVLGDAGTRRKEEREVRDAYLRWTGNRPTDLWLMLGDNAYTSGTDSEYQGSVFDTFGATLRQSVLWPCLGNHDAGSANSPIQFGVYYDIFSLPTQGQAGGVMSGTEAYYSFDYANIHVICLDSSDSDWTAQGLMMRWLKADLEANRQDWLIAYCHHPPYTDGSHNSDQDRDSEARMRRVREGVLPLLEEHGLDLMLSGHSHAYERSFLLDGFYGRSTNLNAKVNLKDAGDGRAEGRGIYRKPSKGPAPHEGAVYIVAGSSGQTSGGQLKHPTSVVATNSLGSLVLDFDGPRLEATFINEKAEVRDHFTIQKGP